MSDPERIDPKALMASIDAAQMQAAAAEGVTLEQRYERIESDYEREERRIKQERERKLACERRASLERTGLPSEDLDAICASKHVDTKPTQHVIRWIDDKQAPPILVMLGGVGVGKTYAAAVALYRDACGWTSCAGVGEFVRATELAERYDPWKHEREDGVKPLRIGGSLLVLDDLGSERAGDARFHEALFGVVDARMSGVRTLITSNLAKADIRARYGDRVADRLNHVARCVEIGGKSLRRQGAGL